MNSEDQYIYEQFQKNFIKSSYENIVIYGTGIHTQILLENLPENTVTGLMDAKRTGEILWNHKVLSYEEVARLSSPIIVIVARNAVINVIYRRIADFASLNHIPVYAINGVEFHNQKTAYTDCECFSLTKDTLKDMISDAETVTFDIFDTLITRRILRPTDIFLVMDKKLKEVPYVFSTERIKAEASLHLKNPTIEQIYIQLQKNLHLTEKETRELLNLEIDTEKQFLIKRDSMCALLDDAAKAGKKVYLVSDMYLSKTHLQSILHKLGINNYDDLLVSCDFGCSKEEGLFEILIDKMNLVPDKCLHIGDNLYADINAARKAGMKTFHVYGAVEMLEQSIYSQLIEDITSLESNIILSDFAVYAFNDPFGNYEKNGKLIIGNDEQLTKLVIAPVIFKYLLWLIQKINEYKIALVIFPSRDGFILNKIYEELSLTVKDIYWAESKYLYTSRRSAMVAAAADREDVVKVLSFPDTRDLDEVIKARFNLKADSVKELDDIEDKLFEELLEVSAKERQSYKKYLNMQLPNTYERVAFVDFVAMGSIQEALQIIQEQEFQGLYFMRRITSDASKEKLKCDSLYPMANDFSSKSKVYQYYYFLENIMTSYEPTVINFTEDGQPVFYEEKRSPEQLASIKKCHEVIKSYCMDLYHLCWNPLEWVEDVKIYDELLGIFSSDYSKIENSNLLHLVNIDEYMGKDVTEINR